MHNHTENNSRFGEYFQQGCKRRGTELDMESIRYTIEPRVLTEDLCGIQPCIGNKSKLKFIASSSFRSEIVNLLSRKK